MNYPKFKLNPETVKTFLKIILIVGIFLLGLYMRIKYEDYKKEQFLTTLLNKCLATEVESHLADLDSACQSSQSNSNYCILSSVEQEFYADKYNFSISKCYYLYSDGPKPIFDTGKYQSL